MEIRKLTSDIMDMVSRAMTGGSIRNKVNELPHLKTQIFNYLRANFSFSNHRTLYQARVSLPKTSRHFLKFKLTKDNLENFKCAYREKGAEGLLETLSRKEIKGLLKSKELLSPVIRAEIFRVFEEAYPEKAQKKGNATLGDEIKQSLPLFADSWNDPAALASNLMSVLEETVPEKLDYYFGVQGLFPISDLSLKQNKALQDVLIKNIPSSPSSQKDLLNCTFLYGLRAASNHFATNVLSDSCDFANLFLDAAKGALENPEIRGIFKENLRFCLNFFDKTIQPILRARALETTEPLKRNTFWEANTVFNFGEGCTSGLGWLSQAYDLLGNDTVTKQKLEGLIPRDVMDSITEEVVPQEQVKQLILDEVITKQREYNSKIRFACKELNLQQSGYDSWGKIVKNLDKLVNANAERIRQNPMAFQVDYKDIVAMRQRGHDESQFWVRF